MESSGNIRRRRRRTRAPGPGTLLCVLVLAVLVGVALVAQSCRAGEPNVGEIPFQTAAPSRPVSSDPTPTGEEDALTAFAQTHGLTLADWPQSVLELMERNPETEDFVLNYPLEHGKAHHADISGYDRREAVPLFMQWDAQWGYIDYGSGVAGLTGCGPVCLSMVGYYLTGDAVTFRPDNVLRFSMERGYCAPGSGTKWTLISRGGVELGLKVTELPLDENRIFRNLEAGKPIICIMGPGDFTTQGHFIVLAGVEGGKIRVNDPNSRANSQRLWSYREIRDQIRNLWAVYI